MTLLEPSLACKFGGSSVADADQIRKIAAIIRADPRRRFVVVSAPGKRHSGDDKITDLLYQCQHLAAQGQSVQTQFHKIRDRFESIGAALGVSGVSAWIDDVEIGLKQGATADWAASRGEYLSARLIAAFLKARFVDATEGIRFTPEGRLDTATYALLREAVSGNELCVIPGFYGLDAHGHIKTFSRGGSDVTGAIVARAVNAQTYENWTDVDGLLMADPRLIANPRPIREVTYQELRELAYMGASVLHDEAIFPVREAGIPIHIRNTNAPELPGTWIRATRPNDDKAVVGVAGRRGFTTIQIEKALMNQEIGFGRKALQVLEENGLSFEHAPSSIDTMSLVLHSEELARCHAEVIAGLQEVLQPDRLEVLSGLALIATVGQGMSHRVGVAGTLFGALQHANVNIRMMDQGASEINIIVGVIEADFERAIKAIYEAFVPHDGQ